MYLMWFLSACLITALPGSSPSFSAVAAPKPSQKQRMHLTVKGSHLIFICVLSIFINPSMNMTIAPLFTADFQIKDLYCR